MEKRLFQEYKIRKLTNALQNELKFLIRYLKCQLLLCQNWMKAHLEIGVKHLLSGTSHHPSRDNQQIDYALRRTSFSNATTLLLTLEFLTHTF